MSSYLWEILIWALLAYALGCILGCWFRKLFASEPELPPPAKVEVPKPKAEIPAVAKVAVPAAAAAAAVAVAKAVTPPPPPPVVKAPPPPPAPVRVAAPPPPPPVRVAAPPPAPAIRRVEPAPVKVETRTVNTKRDPLPTVRAGTTTLEQHVTRKAEEVHVDKNVRRVEGGQDRVLETRHGTTRVAAEHLNRTAAVGTTTRVTSAPAPVARAVETPRVTTVARPAASAPVARPVEAARVIEVKAPTAERASAPLVRAQERAVEVEVGGARMQRPKGIAAARGGKPDDLQRISGVGPKNEKILHKLGFFHFDQIADWSAAQVDWVDDHLKFGGRIARENWKHQASLLASGKEAEFLKQYGTGGMKNKDGDKVSGSKTRK
jgi:predicted flap endonuclease-1-like 5' DNA nuclease